MLLLCPAVVSLAPRSRSLAFFSLSLLLLLCRSVQGVDACATLPYSTAPPSSSHTARSECDTITRSCRLVCVARDGQGKKNQTAYACRVMCPGGGGGKEKGTRTDRQAHPQGKRVEPSKRRLGVQHSALLCLPAPCPVFPYSPSRAVVSTAGAGKGGKAYIFTTARVALPARYKERRSVDKSR